jgi:hypothetical protein
MDIDALLLLLSGGFVVIRIIRALAWLINLPKGALVDVMLAAEIDDDDLHSRSPARRNRYRELRR